MKYINQSVNIVIVAHSFNPSILEKHWMISKGILNEDDFEKGCIFLPVVSKINTNSFQLLVIPEQIQFIPKSLSNDTQNLINEKLFSIIDMLPHTPYTAIGLNFTIDAVPDEQEFADFNRYFFYNANNPIFNEFDSADSRYGAYLSKDVFNCRLKLEIKPVKIKQESGMIEAVKLAFNFHKDLSKGNQVEEIRQLLSVWIEAKNYSQNILEKLTPSEDQ